MMDLIELILVLASVLGVVDGQTIQVKTDTGETGRVKLTCIDIPKTAPLKYHLAAKQKLQKLLPTKTPVVIRFVGQQESDRALGEVYLNTHSINLQLVKDGDAIVDQDTLSHCAETRTQYLIAQANAKNLKLGLWRELK